MIDAHVSRPITAAALLLLFAGAPAAAQRDAEDWLRDCEREAARSERVVSCEVQSATTSLAAGALAVDAGPNGGIVVRGGDVRDVEIRAGVQVRARTERAVDALARDVRVRVAPGEIRSTGPRTGRDESWSVTYFITVPREADLDLATVNGPVGIREVTGRIRATTTNGPLRLDALSGDVRARTSNGPLSVALRGGRWAGRGLDAETVNGPVSLVVPDGYSAALEAGTINGPVSLGFPLTITVLGRRDRRFVTDLGEGGAPIRVVTTNGPFSTARP